MKKVVSIILASFARKIVQKYNPDIIAITGSVGKTSAKEAIVHVLGAHFSARGNEKSYNNELGVPLTVIGMHAPGRSLFGVVKIFLRAVSLLIARDASYPSILVVEMGADAPGDIEYLTSIAPPKIGVITAIGPAHLEKFGSVEKIAEEKKKIFCRQSTSDHWMVLNADDPYLFPLSKTAPSCVMTFGANPSSNVRISDIKERYVFHTGEKTYTSGVSCELKYGDQSVHAEFPYLVGSHVMQSMIASVAVGCIYRIPLQTIVDQLQDVQSAPGRMHLISGIKQTLIIDDTYNSSQKSARAALDVLASFEIDGGARKIAVLGDMREMGVHAPDEHRALGTYVAQKDINFLFAVGENASFLAAGARENGLDGSRIFMFNDSASAGRALQDFMREGDVLLIKASQNVMRMERIVKEIMAEPLRAHELLVRQDAEWS